jgi:hypothetical protein
MRVRLTAAAAVAGVGAAVGGSMGGFSAAAAGVLSHPSPSAHHAEVTANAHFDTSPPMRTVHAVGTPGTAHSAHRNGRGPNAPTSSQSSPNTSGSSAKPLIPSTTVNFRGIGANGSAPPDNDGAAGTTQYVELVNQEYAVFNKTGGVVQAARNTNTLWSGFGGDCETHNDGDGTILWDSMAQRWFIQQFTIDTTLNMYNDCIAISTSADATGTWNRYSFAYLNFPDYPKTGVWPDAYYASFNLFDSTGTVGLGTEVCAWDRNAMLNGTAATQQCFMATSSGEHTLLPATLDGTTQPPAGEPEWYVGLSPNGGSALGYYRFHVDWTTPLNSTLSAETDLPVNAFSQACGGGTCIPQYRTSQRLDSLGDRLMFRLAYRNFGDHEAMVVTHSVTAGTSVGARWYELRPSGGNLTVYQQGTYAPDSKYRWMGSIAMDQSGDMALGYSVSSGSMRPGIRYTGRLSTDALGTMPQGEVTIITGAGSQSGQSLSRWGDYTEMTVDPTDDCTFWYVNQYQPSTGAFNWATRIGAFKFAQCGGTVTNDFSISANPNTISVNAGSNGTSTISTAVISGSAQTVSLTASGLPSGAGASFNPTSVTAGSSSLMTITTSVSTPGSTYTVTVTGTGTSATHVTTVSLTVSGSPPPPGCPASWTCADIGNPTPPGSETMNSGNWTINAGGSDIFVGADQFRYEYQSLPGTSNTVAAHITGQSNTNAWAKAGVMMRADNSAGSPQFSVLITPGNGIFVEYRSTAGGTSTRAGTVTGKLPPQYIWVVRSGTTFSGYYSSTNNLGTATKLFSQTIAAMSGTVLEGLAATSHNTSALCTVTMDSVNIS